MTRQRKREELEESCVRYPDFSPFVLLKLSMVRYGAQLTDAALNQLQSPQYSFGSLEPFGIDFEGRPANLAMPGAILLRDATNVYINYGETYEDPYIVDWDAERKAFVLKEDDVLIDVVDFVPRPAFFGKKTSKGTPYGGGGRRTGSEADPDRFSALPSLGRGKSMRLLRLFYRGTQSGRGRLSGYL